MNNKYELTETTITTKDGVVLYQIRALYDIGEVKSGSLGGFIQSEANLTHDGNAWVYGDARVYGNACVHDNARVYGNACVHDNARVHGNARVYDNACVFGNARVFGDAVIYGYVHDNARVHGNARVYGNACVFGNALIYGDARVHDNARVYGNACVHGNAQVYDNARVFGDAWVFGDAIINEAQFIQYGYVTTKLDIIGLLKHSIGVIPAKGKVILYKRVHKDYSSEYDSSFIYPKSGLVEVVNAEESNESCASGLHFSHFGYGTWGNTSTDYIFLVAEIRIEDIITIQHGKVRCRKANIIDNSN